jgi:hypothetical protein
MKPSWLLLTICALLLCAGCGGAPREPAKPRPDVSFKPQEMTDALHAVIAADRLVYARDIMQRLEDARIARPSEQWEQEKALPLPAHMLRLATHEIQRQGAEFHYVVRSLSPINSKNGPQTLTEKAGLQFVLDHPQSNYYAEESLGGRRYFTAVYADRAAVKGCVECHNQHPASPRKDFKPGDIIGGLVVRVPLEF